MATPTDIAIINSLTVGAPAVLLLTSVVAVRALMNASRRPLEAIFVPVVCSVCIAAFFNLAPPMLEDLMNHGRAPVKGVHVRNARLNPERFNVADLHCDALLWGGRDLLSTKMHPFLKDHPIGAVDVPRLLKGRVGIQVFAAVNAVPRTLSFLKNERPHPLRDALVLKCIFERWPIRSWLSPKDRVLHQFERLTEMSNRSNGTLKIVRRRADLERPTDPPKVVHAIMAVEGLSCLNNNLNTVNEFFDVGIRVLGPTHFFDTEVGGALSGVCECGLTEFGKNVMLKMKSLGMIVDLAHASRQLMADILDMEEHERPALMISHTGINGVCEGPRSLNDEFITKIARAGGLIGIALFDPALCGDDLMMSFVASIKHVSKVLGGVRAIAIGSDWDGKVFTAVSAEDTHVLSTALLSLGNFSHSEVKSIMYDNARSFFEKSLPE